ncbi:hypothetical protein HOY80DRAFT_974020, partial [Tuber brumale]
MVWVLLIFFFFATGVILNGTSIVSFLYYTILLYCIVWHGMVSKKKKCWESSCVILFMVCEDSWIQYPGSDVDYWMLSWFYHVNAYLSICLFAVGVAWVGLVWPKYD